MLGYSLHYCSPINDRRTAQVVCNVYYFASLMDVLFSLFFLEHVVFILTYKKSAQPARTNDGWHPKPDCVTYVTVKELGGNHFAGRCYDCFC